LGKLRPRRITNTFGKFMILDHVQHKQIFIGNEIARFHYAQCRFDGKVFTLPTDLEVLSS
jgi:hypothetical protein